LLDLFLQLTKKIQIMRSKKIYQNLLNDFGFKYVFRQPKFLIPFLNDLLQGKEKIKKATILNPELLSKTEHDRCAVFDIYCENEKGEKILLEMQNCNQKFFLDRSLYYSSFLIQLQSKKGKWDFHLKKMYIIGILNFIPPEMKDTSDCICRAKLVDVKTKAVISEKLNFLYVSLPRFKKGADELKTPMDYWLYTLIHSQPKHNIDEAALKKKNLFAELLDTIKLNNLNRTEMKTYQVSERNYKKMSVYFTGCLRDGCEEGLKKGIERGMRRGIRRGIRQGRAEGIKEGIVKGIAKGRVEGMAKGVRQIALNALKQGYSIKKVSTLTNLTLSELKELQKQ
jgi:predicted transposase/invertase (TIGR01784 family)